MNTKIVMALVAIAFVAGMLVQAIPAEASQQDCKRDEKSSCWIRVSQILKTTINKLEAINNHFGAPPDDITAPPDDEIPSLRALLADLKNEINEIQMTQTDWEFILERAG